MPPPLEDGLVEYEDGTPATVSQMVSRRLRIIEISRGKLGRQKVTDKSNTDSRTN